jgi:cytochrome c-type biogenesis protein CcmH
MNALKPASEESGASRRQFLAALATLAAGGSAVALMSRTAGAQGVIPLPGKGGAPADTLPDAVGDSMASMPGMTGVVKPVRLPPKPGARPSMTADERDALEHRLHCQCGTCTLDIFTCRTTDFSCQVSPAMHRDVMALVEGGYGAQDILDAFVGAYGEKVLMEPKKSGFDLVGWITPGAALIAGGVVVAVLLRRWGARAAAGRPAPSSTAASGDLGIGATADELARLDAAVRGESEGARAGR